MRVAILVGRWNIPRAPFFRGGGVSGEFCGSGVVRPYAVFEGDDFVVVQAVSSHAESQFGNELRLGEKTISGRAAEKESTTER